MEVRSQGEAQQVLQAAADAIHGLGRGGNVPQAPPQPSVQGKSGWLSLSYNQLAMCACCKNHFTCAYGLQPV